MKNLVHRIFESMHLKQIKHEWRRMAWIQFPGSVAEHVLIAAQIGRYLAVLEWVDPHQVVTTLVFHDNAETRIGDLHRVATRYIHTKKEAEELIIQEQTADVPWWEQLRTLLEAYENKTTDVALVVKDADYLEMAFQAKIYLEQGYSAAQTRIINVWNALKTESAKQLWTDMQTVHSTDWWQWLQKIVTE